MTLEADKYLKDLFNKDDRCFLSCILDSSSNMIIQASLDSSELTEEEKLKLIEFSKSGSPTITIVSKPTF